MPTGVIDIGSSSIKLIVGEISQDGLQTLEFLKNLVPLGDHAFTKGGIPREIINQVVDILVRYRQLLQEYGVADASVVATTAVREARNRDLFLDVILRRTGFRVDVLTVGDVVFYIGAFLSFHLKRSYPVHARNLLVAELGSGGVDISLLKKGATVANYELPSGVSRVRQLLARLDGSREENLEAVEEYLDKEFSYVVRILPEIPIHDLFVINEGFTELLRKMLAQAGPESDFFRLQGRDVVRLLKQCRELPRRELAEFLEIEEESADNFTACLMLLALLLRISRKKHLILLETSLAQAVLAHRLSAKDESRHFDRQHQLLSLASALGEKYHVDLPHARQVVRLSEALFDHFRELLGLKPEEKLYLVLAAQLHDLGIFIHNRGHQRHTEYLINSLSLFRLSEAEIRLISTVARFHRRSLGRDREGAPSLASAEAQLQAQKLGALLRVANALDISHLGKVKRLAVEDSVPGELTLTVQTRQGFLLEKSEFREKKSLLEELVGLRISLVVR